MHDADSHIHEPPGYAERYADPWSASSWPNGSRRAASGLACIDEAIAKQHDPEFRAKDADEIMLRKNWLAIGAVHPEDRPHALDLLGFASQLVFTHLPRRPLRELRTQRRPRLAYGAGTRHTTAASSTSAASTRGCCRLLRAASPTSSAPPRSPARRSTLGRGRADDRRPSRPTASLAEPHRPRPACGRRRRRPACRSCSTSAAAAAARTRSTWTTACRRCPTSTAATPTSRSCRYMAIPYPPMQTLADDDHRRRARPLPAR